MPVFPLISGCLRLFPLILQGGGAKRGLGAKVGKKINHRVTEAQSQAEPGGKRGPRIQESRDKIGRALEMHKWEEAVG